MFSGALSKTGYQIGFVKALLKYIERQEIKAISGASMGMLCGYALATDKFDVFEELFRNVDIGKKLQLLYQVFAKDLLRREIKDFVSVSDCVTIPFAFPICYIPIYNVQYYWLRGDYNPIWFKYMFAAVNYPFLHLLPSLLNRRLAIDGGAADNIPLFPLLGKGRDFLPEGENFDLVIVMHFDARYDYRRDHSTDVPILELDLSICNNFNKSHYNFSAEYVAEMIDKAEQYGDEIFGKLFGGDCSAEHFRQVIDEIFLREHALRQQNVSLDRMLGWLNQVGKLLRNDADCNKKLY